MNETSWRIRHIRHPAVVAGMASAPSITVLWRVTTPDQPIEYRVALCSPKDQFSRKKGIEVAMTKESQFVPAKEEFQLVDVVLDYKSKNKLRPQTVELINWFIGNTYSQKVNTLVNDLVSSYRDKVKSLISQ
jgi:hypothetical protein